MRVAVPTRRSCTQTRSRVQEMQARPDSCSSVARDEPISRGVAIDRARCAQRLRRACDDRGWTQKQLARELLKTEGQSYDVDTVDAKQSLVWKWFNAKAMPGNRHRELLRQIFGLSDVELGFVSVRPLEEFNPEADDAAMDAAGQLGARFSRSASGHLDVPSLRARTDEFRHQDREGGTRLLHGVLSAHVSYLDALLGESLIPTVREELATALAEAASLYGWQSLDLGDLGTAHDAYELAARAAMVSENPSFLAHVTAERAYVLLEHDRGHRHVALARQVVEHAIRLSHRAVPTLLSCWLHAASAEIAAADGDERSCRRSIEQAYRYLDGADAIPELPFIILDEDHLGRWVGNCLARLGDPGAIEHLDAARRALDPSFVRARAVVLADLAGAYIGAGNYGEAAELLDEAATCAYEVDSARVLQRLRLLKRELARAVDLAS